MSKYQIKARIADPQAHVKGVASKPPGNNPLKPQNKKDKDAGKRPSADHDAKGASKTGI